MGIDIPEPEYSVGNCLTCWPAGKTPRFVWLTFNGIQLNPEFVPTFPNPYNGTYKVDVHPPPVCRWEQGNYAPEHLTFIYVAAPTSWITFGDSANPANHFLGSSPDPCIFFFHNTTHLFPPFLFFGGTCQVSWTEPP